MALGSIEFQTIARAQDYSAIKQNEDNKPVADQANIGQQVERNVEQRLQEVHTSDNAQWHEKNPDAKEKGNNSYEGDGGQKRKKKPEEGRVVVKGQGGLQGFDIKI